VLPAVRELVLVERLQNDLQLLLEEVAVRVLVEHRGAEGLQLPRLASPSDPAHDAAPGEDVGHRVVLGQPDRMPLRQDAEGTPEPEVLGHPGQVHACEQRIRDHLEPLRLEMVLRRPQRVVAQVVHQGRDRLQMTHRSREVLGRVVAVVGGDALEPDILEVHPAHEVP
jgi:hypothetical protein